MLHYTWGTLVEEGGNKVWTFDKREYTAAELEKQVRASIGIRYHSRSKTSCSGILPAMLRNIRNPHDL